MALNAYFKKEKLKNLISQGNQNKRKKPMNTENQHKHLLH